MTATERVSIYSGMAGAGDPAGTAPAVLLTALAAWILVPLVLAVAVFHRRAV